MGRSFCVGERVWGRNKYLYSLLHSLVYPKNLK